MPGSRVARNVRISRTPSRDEASVANGDRFRRRHPGDWGPSDGSKSAVDSTREQLLARGWTKERLLEVARKYEWIEILTPGGGNPSAAGRAAQLREIVKQLF